MKRLTATVALIAALFGYTMVSLAQDGHARRHDSQQQADSKQPPKVFNAPQKAGTRATCPVSGQSFTITKDTEHSEYKGKYVYFCCPGCKPQFDSNPEKYLSPQK